MGSTAAVFPWRRDYGMIVGNEGNSIFDYLFMSVYEDSLG
jgi:hypothetical protein